MLGWTNCRALSTVVTTGDVLGPEKNAGTQRNKRFGKDSANCVTDTWALYGSASLILSRVGGTVDADGSFTA